MITVIFIITIIYIFFLGIILIHVYIQERIRLTK